MRSFFVLFSFIFLTLSDIAYCDDEEEVRVTLTRAPLIGNPDAVKFVDQCMDLAPHYYRFTSLPQVRHLLGNDIDLDQLSVEERNARIQLSAYDSQDLLGWYYIYEHQGEDEEIPHLSGILGLEGDSDTGYIDVSLIFLPPTHLLSRSGLSRKVLELSKEIIEPIFGKEISFFTGTDASFEPKYKNQEVKGVSASIYCRNYPSLISSYRAGFRVFALAEQNILGHEFLLSYPPYKPGSIPAIEDFLDIRPETRRLAAHAQTSIRTLENRETRARGKLALWDIHLRSSGLYRFAGWAVGGLSLAYLGYKFLF